MSKIIKINTDYKATPEYRSALTDSVELLNNIEFDLQNLIVNLATTGKWKEWSDSIPVGSKFDFTEEMLKDTGDNNVNELAGLLENILILKEKLKLGL